MVKSADFKLVMKDFFKHKNPNCFNVCPFFSMYFLLFYVLLLNDTDSNYIKPV